MKVLKPLCYRPIALLWGGQVFSCIGDEVYAVAVVWLAASLVGDAAGYVVALQAASVLACGLLGGAGADRWDRRRTMIWVDVVRGVAVGTLPLAASRGPVALWSLLPVIMLVSGLRAFFDPALSSSIPELVPEAGLLHATNSLMESTSRFARVVGPGMVGLLNRSLPMIHFFTFDAVTFLASAVSVASLRELRPKEARGASASGIAPSLASAYRLIVRDPLMRYSLLTSGLALGAWNLVFPLGIGLLVHQRAPGDVGAFGWVISAYGVGNLVSNLLVGSIGIRRPERLLFAGRMMAGVGMIGLGFASGSVSLMLASAWMAVGGPMHDVARLTLIQTRFERKDIGKVHRFWMSVSSGWLLAMFLASPTLFGRFSVPRVVSLCGLLLFATGAFGLFRYGFPNVSSDTLPGRPNPPDGRAR